MSSPVEPNTVRRPLTSDPSEEVILALADIADVDPLEFDRRLSDAVDPDALDRLADWSDGGEVAVSFTFGSYAVTVDGSQVVVEDRENGR